MQNPNLKKEFQFKIRNNSSNSSSNNNNNCLIKSKNNYINIIL